MAFTISNFKNWIAQGAPFDKGVQLYQEHGSSKALLTLFNLGENSYSTKKLKEALKGLGEPKVDHCRQLSGPSPTAQDDIAVRKASGRKSSGHNSSKADTSNIHNELVILYKNQSNLHSKMKVTRKKDHRKKLAFRILDIGVQIRELSARKTYIETHGSEPPKSTLDIGDITDRALLLRKLMNNRSYLSHNQNNPDKKKEVKRRIKENTEIEKILKSYGDDRVNN